MGNKQLASFSKLGDRDNIKMHSIIEITVQTKNIENAVDSIISALYSVSFPGCWTLDKVGDKEIDKDIILNDGSKKDGDSDREKVRYILETLEENGGICGSKLRFKYTDSLDETDRSELDLDNEFNDKLRELENGR